MKYVFGLVVLGFVFGSFGNRTNGDGGVVALCQRYTQNQASCPAITPIACGAGGECDIWDNPLTVTPWSETEEVDNPAFSGYKAIDTIEHICAYMGFCEREEDPNNEGEYFCVKEPEEYWLQTTRVEVVLDTDDPCPID